ncbi:hypothetical protein BC834DRAFT_258660 [Gloeopeniophorella convolvens]|nr:hypothetical protein BC834DRAFT_258660 [Gloeopeniophorella convolvens]
MHAARNDAVGKYVSAPRAPIARGARSRTVRAPAPKSKMYKCCHLRALEGIVRAGSGVAEPILAHAGAGPRGPRVRGPPRPGGAGALILVGPGVTVFTALNSLVGTGDSGLYLKHDARATRTFIWVCGDVGWESLNGRRSLLARLARGAREGEAPAPETSSLHPYPPSRLIASRRLRVFVPTTDGPVALAQFRGDSPKGEQEDSLHATSPPRCPHDTAKLSLRKR